MASLSCPGIRKKLTLGQIGLFSAIVTAFFIDAFSRLQPDQGSITNALLSNLTDIVLLTHGATFDATNLSSATTFKPNPNDVRETILWSVSLALSVSFEVLLYDVTLITHLAICRYPLQLWQSPFDRMSPRSPTPNHKRLAIE
jgi:hypothetical protein